MSQAGLLFITTPNADQLAIDCVLLHLRDWEFGSEGNWDTFHIVRTKDVEAFKTLITDNNVTATTPPHPEDCLNMWQASSLSEVESFMLNVSNRYHGTADSKISTSNFILLDSKRLEEKTCIVGEHHYDGEANTWIDAFNKVRVPWQEVHSMWANLDVGNMPFEEFCVDEEGCDEDHWWRWDDSENGPSLGLSEELRAMREDAIQKMKEKGAA